ncbi:MAG: phosphatase PAP2 family protein [Actinobacteria bacterium]|nr:phosphatase PAP2 family protein [Actinomycetota bacterium]
MKWPTATQAAIAAVTAGIVALILRRSRPTRLGDVMFPAATEFALVASLYSVWRVAKKLPLTQSEGAVERAREIVRLQDFLHLPSELSLQQFALAHDQVGWLSTAYYAVAHVPATIIFLVWLFVRHRDKYPHWRNALAILTAFCLFIRFVHVAPPRFLTDLGATGHHWWLDGAVALGLLWAALRIDTVSRRIFASKQPTPTLMVDPRDHEVASTLTAD